MFRKLMIVNGMVVFLLSGCNAQQEKKKDNKVKHYEVEETNISGVEQITINGSPIPPKGYDRPIVDEKTINK